MAGISALRSRLVLPVIIGTILAGTMSACVGYSTGASTSNTHVAEVSSATPSPRANGFSSTATATGRAGTLFSFKVATTSPDALVTETGALPAGVVFRSQIGEGAVLTGVPATGSGGVYDLVFSAKGSAGKASQPFVLTIDEGPAFIGGSRIVTWALKYNYTPIQTTGYPPASITETGTLPSGMVFRDHGNGTADIAGNPKLIGATGVNSITITAQNSVGQTKETIDVTAVNGSSLIHLVFSILGKIL
jgi:hypothetical protein